MARASSRPTSRTTIGPWQNTSEAGARRLLATHGFAGSLARHLREAFGIEAEVLPTSWEGEAGAERTDEGGEP